MLPALFLALFVNAQSALLDVPYMTQTPALCGGAAVTMVMRYWGASDVFPQDFAEFVEGSGIKTETLARASRRNSWNAVVLPRPQDTTHSDIRSHIDAGRPVIALIAAGSNTYHYVVIVGATSTSVVVHDPARAPFRVLPWQEFDEAWAAADQWAMLVLPPGNAAKPSAPAASIAANRPANAAAASPPATPCSALVDHGVQLAVDGNAEESERALATAVSLCPTDPAPLRELAGLRFSQKRWSDARAFAARALRLAPNDEYAWELAATSAYMAGDTLSALDAWQRAAGIRVDQFSVTGLSHTRQPLIVNSLGLEPRAMLTAALIQRAERRLEELPVADSARIGYTPGTGGTATINVFVDERPRFAHDRISLAVAAGRAIFSDELTIATANPLGLGDAEHAMWRWNSKRPHLEGGLVLPSPYGLPGLLSFNASWDKQSYAAGSSSDDIEQDTRRRAGFTISDWPRNWLRWQAGAAFDRFDGRRFVSATTGLEVRLHRNRSALAASGSWWAPTGDGARLWSTRALAAWRSTTDISQHSVSAKASVTKTSLNAPRALWPGAGTGGGRDDLLRAHDLLADDVLSGGAFGRTLAHASIELVQPLFSVPLGHVAIAAFVDAARAWRGMDQPGKSPLFVDTGIGLRVRAPGQNRFLRVDIARGRDGHTALSAGWMAAWPR